MTRGARRTRRTRTDGSVRRDVAKAPTGAVGEYVRRAVAARSDQGLLEAIQDAATLDQLAHVMSRPAQQESRSVA